MLNALWIGFFLIAFMVGLARWLLYGEGEVFNIMMTASFEGAKNAFEIALGLTGAMTLWLGLLRVAEQGGVLAALTRLLQPLFVRLFPEVPRGHPAEGAMTMNIAANMLGLDNAATPMGLKAMRELQTLNPSPDTASNAQVLFLVINTAAVTLFPIAVFTYRAQQGATHPTEVYIPLLLATYAGTLSGFFAVASQQRIRLYDPVLLLYLGGLSALIAGLAAYFATLPQAMMQAQSSLFGNLALMSAIMIFLLVAAWRRVRVYEVFIKGAKEGFSVAIGIVPYLVAMLVAIGVLRASGALEWLLDAVRTGVAGFGHDTRFVDALPTALLKPLSGSAARAMMVETMQTHGVDSFAARLSALFQGSSETTFYVLAVYCGAAGLRYTRHAIPCALLADLAAIIASIAVAYAFFG